MTQKFLIVVLAVILCCIVASAQQKENPDSIAIELEELVVQSKHPATKLVGTSLITNIVGSELQGLGTALDVLQQLPLITVTDQEVAVTGKGKPEILIDGRPLQSEDELTILRSNNIKKVELILAPGAEYSGETRAVLKISTRRRFIEGLSAVEKVEVSARRKWSANELLDINYRLGAWDFFATGTVARKNSIIKGTTTNTLKFDGKETTVGSSQSKMYPSTTGVMKAGINHSAGDRSFGAYYRFNPERGNFCNNGNEWVNNEPPLSRNINTTTRSRSHLGSAYYEDIINGRYLLHFDGTFRYFSATNAANTSYDRQILPDVNSTDSRNSTLWAGKIYGSFPSGKNKFTLGLQDSYTRTSLDYKMLNNQVAQYIPSSTTEAHQTSLAAFAQWEGAVGLVNIKAGVRFEYVDYYYETNGVKDTEVSRKDRYITPDLSLAYSPNEESQLSLSYRMASIKPPYSGLTGSLSFVGRHEIEGGNPYLKDERLHDIQLFGMWKDLLMQLDYTRSIDTYAYIKRVYPAPTLQLIMRPENINVSALDLFIVWGKSFRIWKPDITLGLHKQWLTLEGEKYNRPIFSYYFDNIITLKNDFLITLNAGGQTRGDLHTNQFGTTVFTLDASLSKSFFDKALCIKLSATDIFNTRCNDWSMKTYGIFVDKRQSYDYRGVTLSVTYNFKPGKSKYKGQSAADAELKRL